MSKEVLVCLEGSASTESATGVAIELARSHGFTLVGLAIVDEPDIRAGTPTGIGGSAFKRERDETLVADAHRCAAEWLERFESRCREASVAARCLEVTGRPAASILAEMSKHDLTVMGQDANFRYETETSDAETRDAILHHNTEKPVLLVPASTATLSNVVLIAFDGSPAAQRVVSSFCATGLAKGRDIHVVTIDDNGERAWEMASRAVESIKGQGIPATSMAVVSALANVDALLEAASKVGACMLVMGAYARTRLAALFGRSVTKTMLARAPIPLFLQH